MDGLGGGQSKGWALFAAGLSPPQGGGEAEAGARAGQPPDGDEIRAYLWPAFFFPLSPRSFSGDGDGDGDG